jgi:hypothetical protein
VIRRDHTTELAGPAADPDRYQRWLAPAVTLAFLVVAGFATASHELWRDEAQPWLVALHSTSLLELFQRIKYEGHPGLWYTCLFLLSRVTASPVAMQALHVAIGAAAVWIVARYAPFTALQRVLFAFGYFPLYEYTVLSRDYGLGMLLLLATCAALGARTVRFPLVVALIALIPHSNVFAAIVGLALGLVLLADRWLPGGPVLGPRVTGRQLAAGVLLVIVSVALAVLQTLPPANFHIELGARPRLAPRFLAKRFRTLVPALMPIPRPGPDWWILSSHDSWWEWPRWRAPAALAAYALLAWMVLGLVRRLRALIFLGTAIIGLVTFMYLEFPGEARHFGYLFVALVMAIWLAKIEDARRGTIVEGWVGRAWVSTQGIVFTALLGVHAAGGLFAVFLERRYVYSDAKPAAKYLVEHHLEEAPLVAQHDFVQGVLVYLGRKEAYLVRPGRVGSFGMWDKERFPPVTDSTCVARARQIAAEQHRPAVLIADHALALTAADSLDTRELARFTGSVVGDEDFYLYLVGSRPPQPKSN